MISLSIDRASLSLDPLVITADPAEDFHLDESVGRPQFEFRKSHAPNSAHAAGRILLAAVMDQADIPCRIYAHAATTAALEVLQAELEEALSQFIYDVTLTVDGVAKTYQAECTTPAWGAFDSGEVRAHLVSAAVSIPVNPPGA